MPVMKIPDSILDKIRCRCGQYLSKIPINIQDGESVCRDCIDEQALTPAVTVQNTSYEALATLFAFPCQFKNQGCPKYVEFNKLEDHEDECSYRIYECPVNLHLSCNWKGCVTQLYEHYQVHHPQLCLESPVFQIKTNEDYETYRILQVDEVVLLLQTKCTVERAKLWFNMVCFRQLDVSHINYTIKLTNADNKDRVMKLEAANPLSVAGVQMVPEKSLDVGIQTVMDFLKSPESIECHWNINISDELKKNIQNQQQINERELFEVRNEKIKCVACGFYMVPPIYRCCHGHVSCVDCRGYYSECKTCQKNDVMFTKANDLEEISRAEQHYCRWINCRAKLPCTQVRQHEQDCSERMYNCPRCNIWSGILDKLLDHFRSTHPETALYLTPSLTFDSQDYVSAYIIAHREVFKLSTALDSNNVFSSVTPKMKIAVWYLGSPSFSTCWEYKVTENSGNSWSLFSRAMNCQSITVSVAPHQNDDKQGIRTNVPTSALFGSPFSGTSSPSSNIFGSFQEKTEEPIAPINQSSLATVSTNSNRYRVFGRIKKNVSTLPQDTLKQTVQVSQFSFGGGLAKQNSQNCASNSNIAPAKLPVGNATFGSPIGKEAPASHNTAKQLKENGESESTSESPVLQIFTLTISKVNKVTL